jgi:hypothetical protein
MARARSRAEQEQIVTAWRRSGQAARTYARRAGVSAASLHRWASLSRAPASADAAMLVEVVPSEAGEARWAWELEFAAGTLRVRAPLEPKAAKVIVEVLARVGRR